MKDLKALAESLEPTPQEWWEKRCAWYAGELDRLKVEKEAAEHVRDEALAAMSADVGNSVLAKAVAERERDEWERTAGVWRNDAVDAELRLAQAIEDAEQVRADAIAHLKWGQKGSRDDLEDAVEAALLALEGREEKP